MKINVERGAFLKALGHVQSVVERRNTIPILSNVLIEASKGRLKLTATDLDIEIVEAILPTCCATAQRPRPRTCSTISCARCPTVPKVQAELIAGRLRADSLFRPAVSASSSPVCRGKTSRR
jgi:DNA polymerase-3 subunit beta